MLTLKPDSRFFSGTILLCPVPGAALAIALFNASATENRIKGLAGFVGAVMFASVEDNRVLELFQWDAAGSLDVVRGDYRFADHVVIVEQHATLGHAGFSTDLIVPEETTFKRGDEVEASGTLITGHEPAQITETLRQEARQDVIHHVAVSAEGCFVVSLSKGIGHRPLSAFMQGATERWRHAFEVVEAIAPDPGAAGQSVDYRLFAAPALSAKNARGAAKFKRQPAARLSDGAYSGLIAIRPFSGRELGTALLNLSETEARIKYLPGFLSATFLTGSAGVCAEVVQWQTGHDLARAFATPEFSEHLPVTEIFVPHPGMAFGNPSPIFMADGRMEMELSAMDYAITLFKTEPGGMKRLHDHVSDWVAALIGDTFTGAAIHADTRQSHVGVLFQGHFSEPPAAPTDLAAYLLEQMGPLQLYACVTPPPEDATPMRYSMAMRPAG